MSSSSSIWHIANQEPDTSQAQVLQDAYVSDPSRFLPDLQGGFRVYGHARKHAPPDPSYFYVDDAMREHQYDAVHPDNKDWMIAYENDNYGQTRILDIPSTRKMRTTMDGMPLGSIQPEDQIAMAKDAKRGPDQGMRWMDAEAYSDQQKIEMSRAQDALLRQVVNNNAGGAAPQSAAQGGASPAADGNAPPEPSDAATDHTGNLPSKNLAAFYASELRNKVPSGVEYYDRKNLNLLFDEIKLPDDMRTAFFDTYDETEVDEPLFHQYPEKFAIRAHAILNNLDVDEGQTFGDYLSSYVVNEKLVAAGVTDPDVLATADTFARGDGISQGLLTALKPHIPGLTPEEQLAWMKFDFTDEKEKMRLEGRLNDYFFPQNVGDPFKTLTTVGNIPGTNLPIPVLNDESTVQKMNKPSYDNVGGPSMMALKLLPGDQQVWVEFNKQMDNLTDSLQITPTRSLTAVAMNVEDIMRRDPKYGKIVAAAYLQMHGESYESTLAAVQIPGLTSDTRNIILMMPQVVDALKTTLEKNKARPVDSTSDIFIDSLKFLGRGVATMDDHTRNVMSIPFRQMINLVASPVNGEKWYLDPKVKPYLDEARRFENFRPTAFLRRMPFAETHPELAQLSTSFKDFYKENKLDERPDHEIAQRIGLLLMQNISSAELFLTTAISQININSLKGYQVYSKVLKDTLDKYDVIYQGNTSWGTPVSGLLLQSYFSKVGDALVKNTMDVESARAAMNDIMQILGNIASTDPEYQPHYNNIFDRIVKGSGRNAPVYDNLEIRNQRFEGWIPEFNSAKSPEFLTQLVTDIYDTVMEAVYRKPGLAASANKSMPGMLLYHNATMDAFRGFNKKYDRISQMPIIEYQTAPTNMEEVDPKAVEYGNQVKKYVEDYLKIANSSKYHTGVRAGISMTWNKWMSFNDFIHDPNFVRQAKLAYHGGAGVYEFYGMAQSALNEASEQARLPELKKLQEEQFAESLSPTRTAEKISAGIDRTSWWSTMTSFLTSTVSTIAGNTKQAVSSAVNRVIVSNAREYAGGAMIAAAGAKGAVENGLRYHATAVAVVLKLVGNSAYYAQALASACPTVFAGVGIALSANEILYQVAKNAEKRGNIRNMSVLQASLEYLLELGSIEQEFSMAAGKAGIKVASTLTKAAVTGGSSLIAKLISESKENSYEGLKDAARRKLQTEYPEFVNELIDKLEDTYSNLWSKTSVALKPALDSKGDVINLEDPKALFANLLVGDKQRKLGEDLQFTPTMEEKEDTIIRYARESVGHGFAYAANTKGMLDNEKVKADTVYPIIGLTLQQIQAYNPVMYQREPAFAIGKFFQRNISEIWAIAMVLKSLDQSPEFQLRIADAVDNLIQDPRKIGKILQEVIEKNAQSQGFKKYMNKE